MIISPNFQIVKTRNKKYDALLHTPYLERTEAEHFLCYYFLRNIEITCYFCLGVELLPYQGLIIRTLLNKPFVLLILTRGGAKTLILGVYSALRAMLNPGSKIVIVGANRRQSLFVFSEITKIYYNKNGGLFRECCLKPPVFQPEESYLSVRSMDKVGKISALPLGQGDKIRGARSNYMLVDEANIVPEDIYTTVLKPMGAVSSNPVEKVKKLKREQALIDAGVIKPEDSIETESNQIIMSSSAGYEFQFLFKQYQDYRKKILEAVKEGRRSPFSIIQIGWEAINKLSPGYLDLENIESSKATFSFDKFQTEYGAQFVSDSHGFFPRSLLEKRTVKLGEFPTIEIEPEEGQAYVMAIDPCAAENDENDYFGIAIGKVDVVNKKVCVVNAHCSTGKRWAFYVTLVREYIRNFKPKYIIIDKFGGGANLASLLGSEEYMSKDIGDKLLFCLDGDDLKTYNYLDNRIIRLVVFEGNWIEQSNIHLKAMLDHESFWFASSPGEAAYSKTSVIADKFDDADDAVKECKNELSLIVGEQNSKGLMSFKLPESLGQVRKKVRVRKDMYTVCILLGWGVKEYLTTLEVSKDTSVPYVPAVDTV